MKSPGAPLSPQLSSEDRDCDADPGNEGLFEDANVNHPDDGVGPRVRHDKDEGYAKLHDGPMKVEVCKILEVNDEEVVDDADSSEATQLARPVPPPPVPSNVVRRRHQLIHTPYQSWCRHCVEGRRNNTARRTVRDKTRSSPCLVADYCFLRYNRDEDVITTAVGKFNPSQAVFACASDVKGADLYATQRLGSSSRRRVRIM